MWYRAASFGSKQKQASLEQIYGKFVPKEKRAAQVIETRSAHFTLGTPQKEYRPKTSSQVTFTGAIQSQQNIEKTKKETDKMRKNARQSNFSIGYNPVFSQETSNNVIYTAE